eukprot:1161875-Pelagomonas_calceolata.AAC.5
MEGWPCVKKELAVSTGTGSEPHPHGKEQGAVHVFMCRANACAQLGMPTLLCSSIPIGSIDE